MGRGGSGGRSLGGQQDARIGNGNAWSIVFIFQNGGRKDLVQARQALDNATMTGCRSSRTTTTAAAMVVVRAHSHGMGCGCRRRQAGGFFHLIGQFGIAGQGNVKVLSLGGEPKGAWLTATGLVHGRRGCILLLVGRRRRLFHPQKGRRPIAMFGQSTSQIGLGPFRGGLLGIASHQASGPIHVPEGCADIQTGLGQFQKGAHRHAVGFGRDQFHHKGLQGFARHTPTTTTTTTTATTASTAAATRVTSRGLAHVQGKFDSKGSSRVILQQGLGPLLSLNGGLESGQELRRGKGRATVAQLRFQGLDFLHLVLQQGFHQGQLLP